MTTNPFWQYTLAVYPRPGVADLLIRLQDEHHADVNTLLLCLWAGSRHLRLSDDQLQALAEATGEWREQCIEPLRTLRRYLKGNQAAEAMREQIKALEVDAEQMQQSMMLALLDQQPSEQVDESFPVERLAIENLAVYASQLSFPPDRAALEALVSLVTDQDR